MLKFLFTPRFNRFDGLVLMGAATAGSYGVPLYVAIPVIFVLASISSHIERRV